MLPESPTVLKTLDLAGHRFIEGDRFFIPDRFYQSQTPVLRDRSLMNLFADGVLSDLPAEWLETDEIREKLFEDPKRFASPYCGNCKA